MKRLCAALLIVPALSFAQAGDDPAGAEGQRAPKQATAPKRAIAAIPAAPAARAPAAEPAAGPSGLLAELKPLRGPARGQIASNATLSVSKGHLFFDEGQSRRFLEMAGNPAQDGHFVYAPESLDWFAVFSFSPVGYVKDDEKVDPDQLLAQIRASDAKGNEERKRLGMEALHTEGWKVPPHYDPSTRRLEWGLAIRTESGQRIVNYTSRILGRDGVMKVVLVADDDRFDADTRSFKTALNGFQYNPGAAYADFRSGDRIAQYGLTALIVGAGAATASKKGLWKLLAGGGALLLAGLAKLFKRG